MSCYMGGYAVFAVIETETVPGRSLIARAADRLCGQDHFDIYEDVSMGTRVLRAGIVFPLDMNEMQRRRLVQKALFTVASAGIKGVVLPAGFGYREELDLYGLVAMDPLPLYRHMAGKLAAYAIKACGIDPSNMICSILSRRLTRVAENAAREVCLQARYLALCCGQDINHFCRELARDYGASVLENPSARLLARSELLIVFDMPKDGLPSDWEGTALLLCGGSCSKPQGCIIADGARLSVPKRLKRFLPDCETTGLLSALVANGALREDELEVEALTFGKTDVL
jgi:hypothetical protein